MIADFSQSTYDALKHIADESHQSMAEAIRDAIALAKWFQDTQAQGCKILVEWHGEIREVLKI
jgi:hypothetical protein